MNNSRNNTLCGIGPAFFWVTLWLFGSPIMAADTPQIVILNSNYTVQKYALMQTEFKAQIDQATQEIDLGGKIARQAWIKNTLYDKSPEVIFCIGSKAYLHAKKWASRDANIIFSLGINWRRFPLTEKTYVVASELPAVNSLILYRYYFPEIKKIGILYSKKNNREWFTHTAAAAKDMNLAIHGFPVTKKTEVTAALAKALPKVDAIWLIPDPIVISSWARTEAIFRQSDALKKPVFAYSTVFTKFGATLIVSPDIQTMAIQAAGIATQLHTHNPITEKIQDPAGTYTAINLQKIDAYGINFNFQALSSINEYIE